MSAGKLRAPLSAAERQRLLELEAAIAPDLRAFERVGRALLEIQKGRLYRADYDTWEDYCRCRWGIGARRGYQLVVFAAVADDVRTIGAQSPNERQARELADLPAIDRQEVWEEATGAGQPTPTAARLRELVEGRLPPEEQLQALRDSEAAILDRRPAPQGRTRQVGGEDRGGRLDQIGRLTGRVRKLVEGLGGDGEECLQVLDKFEEALGRVAA
jgi:hypothetical protein